MEDYYTIQTPGHHSTMFAELHTLQKQGVMCDVILAAEDGEVMAHKVVLMAASKYFRDKLSPVMGPTASKICLKGISVVELANLVKYIYTGKLLVAKETMDITLEISEILELNGVIQGYKEIISYEQMKGSTDNAALKRPAISEPSAAGLNAVNRKPVDSSVQLNTNVQAPKPASQASQLPGVSAVSSVPNIVSSGTVTQSQSAGTDAVSSTSVTAQPDSNQSSKVVVTEQSEDGSSVTYQVDGTRETTDVSTGLYSADYNFDTLLDQQYMDVSAGSRTPSKTPGINSPQAVVTPPKLQQMASLPTDSQKIAAERAQHQDLLAVAIETLSDVPHLKHHPHVSQPEVDRAVSSISSSETVTIVPQNVFKPEEFGNLEDFENGKTNTKTVTMSAGSVSNELGGKTDVYTVALDPASIKSPLKMARPKRSKSAKEKEAEERAKMYRLKKAELQAGMNADLQVPSDEDKNLGRGKRQRVATSKQDFQYESLSKTKKKPFIPRILLSPKNIQNEQIPDSAHDVDDSEVKKSITEQKVIGTTSETKVAREETHNVDADDFGQVVNFDSDDNEEDDVDGMIADNLISAMNSEEKEKGKENVTETKADGICTKGNAEGDSKEEGQYEKKENSRNMSSKMEEKEAQKGNLLAKNADSVSDTSMNPSEKAEQDYSSEGNLENENEKFEETPSSSYINNKELCENEDKDLPDDFQSQSYDEATEEKIRSSATKRKTRTPRKLPLSDEEKGNDSGPDRRENIPVVRSRRSSRSLNLEKEKETKTDLSSSNTEGGIDNSEEFKCKNKIESDWNDENTSKPTEIKIIAHSEVDEKALDEAEKLILDSKSKKIVIVPRNLQPEVRLKKRTTEEMLQMAKDIIGMGSPAKYSSDEKQGEVETYLTGDDDDDYAETDLGNGNSNSSVDGGKKTKDTSKRKNEEAKVFSVLKKRKIVGKIVAIGSKKEKEKALNTDCAMDTGEIGQAHVCPEDGCLFSSKNVSSLRRHQAMFHDKRVTEANNSDKNEKARKSKTASNKKEHELPQKPDQTIVKKEVPDFVEDMTNSFVKSSGDGTANDTEVQPQCSYCGKTFKSLRILKKHLDYTHSDRKKLVCEQCDFTTPFESSMSTHIMLKHTLDKTMLKCKYCTYETPLTGNLRKHIFGTHGLFIITKQLKKVPMYAQYEEGTILTKDGQVFDHETMQLPKLPKRNDVKVKEEKNEALEKGCKKPTRISLNRLPVEEFLKEMMKRHEEYLKVPEKECDFMSRAIAQATEHPSFPQASPQVRNTRANKIYNMKKLKPTFQDSPIVQSQATYGLGNIHDIDQGQVSGGHGSIPQVANEVEVTHDYPPEVVLENVEAEPTPPTTVLTISEQRGDDGSEMIIINQNGKQTVVRSKDFYDTLAATGHDANQTLGVISALLQAGEQIEIREQEEVVEIQNM